MNYRDHYDRLVNRAKNRKLDGYVEKHHVLPKCLGGSDDPENMVLLTAREHYVAHQLLVKLYPGHRGIAYAALLMTRVGRGEGRVNNRMYGWVRQKYAQAQSVWMKKWLNLVGNPSSREEVKRKRSEAWTKDKNPSWKNPNWKGIKAAALKTKGVKQTETHQKRISESLKKWHENNPGKHPMKNAETVTKAVKGRQEAARRKKIVYWGA